MVRATVSLAISPVEFTGLDFDASGRGSADTLPKHVRINCVKPASALDGAVHVARLVRACIGAQAPEYCAMLAYPGVLPASTTFETHARYARAM